MTDLQLSILLDSLAKELEALIDGADKGLPDSVERVKSKRHNSIKFPECMAMICMDQDHYTVSIGCALLMSPLMDFQERLQAYADDLKEARNK